MKPFQLSKEYCAAVGGFTVAWSTIEIALDFVCAILHHDAGGDKLSKELPIGLSQKVKFCRKCFSKLPSLEFLKEDAPQILTQTKLLSKERNRVIHGVPDTLRPVPDGTIIILKAVYEKARVDYDEAITSIKEIDGLAAQTLELGNTYKLLITELCVRFGIENSEAIR